MVRGRDPNAVAVLLEDSAAVTGLLLASGCLGLASYTGNMIYDAIGSISIGGKNAVSLITHIHGNRKYTLTKIVCFHRFGESSFQNISLAP